VDEVTHWWQRCVEWFQVPVCKSYLDPLSLATWLCFLATLQCAAMALFLEPNYLEIWKLTSFWEFPCILYGVSSPGSLVHHLHIGLKFELHCIVIKVEQFL